MTRQIIGSKGGGGGSSFVTKPDTLRSNDSFEILLGLGSGRWKGLVNGLKSLKINDVPMENADGTSNFQDIYAIFADGNPLIDQMVTFKLGGGASTTTVNTQLANPNVGVPGPWVSGASSSLGVNFIDLRFVVQQLYYQDTKGIRENTASIEIQMRPSGTSTWINPFAAPLSNSLTYSPSGYDYNDPEFVGALYTAYLGRGMFNPSGIGFRASNTNYVPITGKTTSPYVKELRIAVPNAGTYANKSWEVRARLIEKDTVDNGDIQERRIVAFESIGGVSSEPVGDHPDWDGLVWLQLYGKASDQFSGFPEIIGEFDTKICKVPPATIFNPATRAYTTNTWAGDYVEAFTTDPAWQIKEFVEDPIHGIAGLQPGATVDKWDALEASKYYSELVPDGKGGTHPRFNMNLTITEARDIDEMMNYLAGAVNSYMEDVGNGVWRLKVDKPETPVMLFTPDNIFGDFNYTHTDVDNRFNDWRGTFIDEDLGYEVNTARVFDQADIDANGIKFTEVALVGCTNYQEALRRLMFRMRVSLNEYKIVSFQTNKVARYLSPLNTILVADAALNTDELVKSTSRIHSYAGTSVTLKRPVRLEVGVNYEMVFTTIDKQTVTRTVTNAAGARGDVTAISINTALPANIVPESAVSLKAVGLPANPLSYRVIGIERSEDDEDTYTVMASIIDSGKWNAMDNVSADELAAQESEISIDPPGEPVGGMFDTLEYATEFAMKRVLQVNWNRPAGNYLQGYRVEYNINNGPFRIAAPDLKETYFELEAPEDGEYMFKIVALDRRGVESRPLIGIYTLDGSRAFSAPTHFRGPLSARPATAPYEGYRYTVTNANPPVTQVWEGGVWVNETNLVTEGSQIGVENGATVGATPAQVAQINGLVTTYGTTLSAAASAALAEDERILAEAARDSAQTYSSNAQGHASTAQGHATNAGLSSSAAALSQSATATFSTNALNALKANKPRGMSGGADYYSGSSGWTFGTDGSTPVINLTTGGTADIYPKWAYVDTPERTYRIYIEARTASGTRSISVARGTATVEVNPAPAFSGIVGSALTFNTSYSVKSVEYVLPASSASPYIFFFMSVGAGASQLFIKDMWVEDVTSEKEASSFAESANTSSAVALAQAALASQSATLSASITPNARNKDPYMTLWTSTTALTNWIVWNTGNPNRTAGFQAQYSNNHIGPAGVQTGLYQTIPFSPGWWVEEMEVTLNSGTLRGVGIHTHSEASGVATGDSSATGLWNIIGDGVVGRTYRVSAIRQWTTACDSAKHYAMTHWTGFPSTGGNVSAANDITIRYCGIRPATEAEIRDKTVLTSVEATVSTQATAIADAASKLAEARLRTKVAASGGNPAILEMYSGSGAASFVRLAADQIYFGDNTVFYDASDVLETTIAGTSVNSIAWGAPFGASNDLLQWYGPTGIALSARDKTNAYFYISTTVPRMGGTALASAAPAVTTVGYGQTIRKVLANGATASFSGGLGINAGGNNGTGRAVIQVSEAGANSWSTVAQSATFSVGPGEAGADVVSGTYENTSGLTKVYEFRIFETRTPGTAGGTINQSQTYLTG